MKYREGFVSNSSSSSFLIVREADGEVSTVADMKKLINWEAFQKKIRVSIKYDCTVNLKPAEWSLMTYDRLASIMLKFYNIMKAYIGNRPLKEAMELVFEKDITRKPVLPKLNDYREKFHKHHNGDGTVTKTTWSSNPEEYISQEEDAFDRFSFAYDNYLDYLKIYTLYKALTQKTNELGFFLFSFGNESIMYDAFHDGQITDYEYRFAQDIRSLNLIPQIFHDSWVASYDYS